MRRKGSRYQNTRPFEGDNAFPGFRERRIDQPEGILEHTVAASDRLDGLAGAYYKDDRRWWRILDGNPDFLYGFELLADDMHGDVVLIPAAREGGQ